MQQGADEAELRAVGRLFLKAFSTMIVVRALGAEGMHRLLEPDGRWHMVPWRASGASTS